MSSTSTSPSATHPWRSIVELLVCPASLQPLREAEPDLVQKVNQAIEAGGVLKVNGQPQVKPLEAALVREDYLVVYPIEQGILVLLEDEGIKWKP